MQGGQSRSLLYHEQPVLTSRSKNCHQLHLYMLVSSGFFMAMTGIASGCWFPPRCVPKWALGCPWPLGYEHLCICMVSIYSDYK